MADGRGTSPHRRRHHHPALVTQSGVSTDLSLFLLVTPYDCSGPSYYNYFHLHSSVPVHLK